MTAGRPIQWLVLRALFTLATACATDAPPRAGAPATSTAPATAPHTALPVAPTPAALAAATPTAIPPAPATPPPPPAPLEATLEPRLAEILRSRKLQGVIARLDGPAAAARCSDPEYCKKPLTPASTFKIPNSMIGLETGVIPDAEFVIPWDGVKRSVEAWNHDHTLRTAIRDSAVPYYQELARRVGLQPMQSWVKRLGYGNMQIGDVVDRFWLDGPLAISALEQVEFLRRVDRAQLPISERTRQIVLDITIRGQVDGRTLHGKTGWAYPGKPSEIGWFVGWVEDPATPRYVAVALEPVPRGIDMMTVRQQLAEEALRLQFD